MNKVLFFVLVLSGTLFTAERGALANRETREIIEMIKNEYDVEVEAIGGSFCDCRVNVIGVDFEMKKKLYLPEARKLLLEMKSKILKKVNKNKELLIYMPNHKCYQDNIDLGITFSFRRNKPSEEYIYYTTAWRRIKYSYFDHKKNKLCHLLDESYEEAFDKVNKN